MVSIRKLFEVAPPAQGVMAASRDFVSDRIAALKQQFSRGRIKASSYQQQLKQLMIDKNNRLSGTFVDK
jgi:hypothetical protein